MPLLGLQLCYREITLFKPFLFCFIKKLYQEEISIVFPLAFPNSFLFLFFCFCFVFPDDSFFISVVFLVFINRHMFATALLLYLAYYYNIKIVIMGQ